MRPFTRSPVLLLAFSLGGCLAHEGPSVPKRAEADQAMTTPVAHETEIRAKELHDRAESLRQKAHAAHDHKRNNGADNLFPFHISFIRSSPSNWVPTRI